MRIRGSSFTDFSQGVCSTRHSGVPCTKYRGKFPAYWLEGPRSWEVTGGLVAVDRIAATIVPSWCCGSRLPVSSIDTPFGTAIPFHSTRRWFASQLSSAGAPNSSATPRVETVTLSYVRGSLTAWKPFRNPKGVAAGLPHKVSAELARSRPGVDLPR